jgi:hypothetical protein
MIQDRNFPTPDQWRHIANVYHLSEETTRKAALVVVDRMNNLDAELSEISEILEMLGLLNERATTEDKC